MVQGYLRFLITLIGIVLGIVGLFIVFCYLYYAYVPGGDTAISKSKEVVMEKLGR